MPDITNISTVLSSIKSATDIAKKIKDSDLTLEKAEMKYQLAEMMNSLAEAKSEMAEIQNLLLEKDGRIRELEESLSLKGNMIWRDPVYYLKTQNGEDGPYCQQCYDNNQKAIRLQTIEEGNWVCKACGNSFFSRDYDPGGAFNIDDGF